MEPYAWLSLAAEGSELFVYIDTLRREVFDDPTRDCVATWRVLFDRARSQLGAEATDLLVAMRASVDKLAYVFAVGHPLKEVLKELQLLDERLGQLALRLGRQVREGDNPWARLLTRINSMGRIDLVDKNEQLGAFATFPLPCAPGDPPSPSSFLCPALRSHSLHLL